MIVSKKKSEFLVFVNFNH